MYCNTRPVCNFSSSTFYQESDHVPDWPDIWAKKFRKTLYELGKTGNGYTSVIKAFISEIDFHPKYVKPAKLRAFIRSAPVEKHDCYREAFSIFYSGTVLHNELKAVAEEFKTSIECTGNRKVEQLRAFNYTHDGNKKWFPIQKRAKESPNATKKTEQLIVSDNRETLQNIAEPAEPYFM